MRTFCDRSNTVHWDQHSFRVISLTNWSWYLMQFVNTSMCQAANVIWSFGEINMGSTASHLQTTKQLDFYAYLEITSFMFCWVGLCENNRSRLGLTLISSTVLWWPLCSLSDLLCWVSFMVRDSVWFTLHNFHKKNISQGKILALTIPMDVNGGNRKSYSWG